MSCVAKMANIAAPDARTGIVLRSARSMIGQGIKKGVGLRLLWKKEMGKSLSFLMGKLVD